MAARPFRPTGAPYKKSLVLAALAQLWDEAERRMAGRSDPFTQSHLAKKSGVPLTTINSWATGKSLPRDAYQLAAVGRKLAEFAARKPQSEREWDLLLKADQLAHKAAAAGDVRTAQQKRTISSGRLDPPAVHGGPFAGRRVPPLIVPPIPAHYETREELLTQARDALLAPSTTNAARMVGLVGMGGGGKSVLARILARDEQIHCAFPDGIVWLELGPSPDLLVRQAHLAELFGDSRPAIDLQQQLARLNDVLSGAACLVVLDNVWKREHLQAFELLEPKSALLVTTRLRDVLNRSAAVPVGPLHKEQSRRLLAAWAGTGEDGLPAQAEEVAAKCGGLPLALAIAGGMVADTDYGWDYVCERLRRADLDKLEIQLRDYPGYENLLLVLHASVNDLTERQQARYLELAVFDGRGDVPVEVVQRLWQQTGLKDNLDAKDLIARLARRSLLRQEVPNGTLILHDLQYSYARRILGSERLQELHARLSDSILHAWGGLNHELPGLCSDPLKDAAGQYGVLHLVPHLSQANQERYIHRLLALNSRTGTVPGRPAPAENTWYAAHDRIGEPAAYSGDVGLAWSLAKKADDGFPGWQELISSIGLEVRYALVTASITSIAANIPPQLLVALVESGYWAAEQGLSYARQLPAAELRAETLTRLVSFLNSSGPTAELAIAGASRPSQAGFLLAESRDEALVATRAVDDRGRRARILLDLAAEHPEPERSAIAYEAWKAGCAIPEVARRAETIAALAAKEKVPKTLRSQVLAAAHAIDHPASKARALTALALHLPPAGRAKALRDANAAILQVNNPADRAVALAELIFLLPETDQAAATNQAQKAVYAIDRDYEKDQALARLATNRMLPEVLKDQILHAALNVQNRTSRTDILTALIPGLSETSQVEALSAALAAAKKINQPEPRAAALTALIPHLREADRTEVLNDARDAIRTINDGVSRAVALTDLAAQLPEHDRPAALAEALADARAINDPRLRATTFAILMARLPRPQTLEAESASREALDTALADARASGDPNSRAVLQSILASLIPEQDEHISVIHAALAEASKVNDPGDKADVLTALAPDLDEPARTTVIDEARIAACTVRDRGRRTAALTSLARQLPETIELQALTTARAIAKAFRVSEALAFTLAHCEPDADERLAVAHALLKAQMMDEAGFPSLMPDTEILGQLSERNLLAAQKEAHAVTEAFGELHSHASALATMTENLNHPKNKDWASDADKAIAKVCSNVGLLQTLGFEFPQELRGLVTETLGAIEAANSWAEGRTRGSQPAGQSLFTVLDQVTMLEPEFRVAFASLGRELPETAHDEAWREARTAALAISDPAARAAALAKLAFHAPKEELSGILDEALAVTPVIDNADWQANILVALTPNLSKTERTAALGQTLKAARLVSEDDRRAHILTSAAEISLAGPTPPWDPHWRAVIEDAATRGRTALLSDLSAISPIIFHLGGSLAVQQSIQGLLDAGRWWQ